MSDHMDRIRRPRRGEAQAAPASLAGQTADPSGRKPPAVAPGRADPRRVAAGAQDKQKAAAVEPGRRECSPSSRSCSTRRRRGGGLGKAVDGLRAQAAQLVGRAGGADAVLEERAEPEGIEAIKRQRRREARGGRRRRHSPGRGICGGRGEAQARRSGGPRLRGGQGEARSIWRKPAAASRSG